jgi:general secretion pathway protein C
MIMVKRYFWLIYVLLVTLVAALGADMAKSYVSTRLATPRSLEPTQTSTAPQRPMQTTFADYQIITARNIFDANPPQATPPEPEKEPPPVAPPVQATQLQLKLIGTVAGANNQYFAIIEDLSKRGSQAVYHLGDIVQNAVVAEIRRTCVLLDKGGQYESLCFQQYEGGPLSGQTTPAPVAETVPEGDDSSIARIDAATWRLNREMVLEQFANFGNLSAQARGMPYIVQGQPRGFRLMSLVPGSMLQKIGLQAGDVIQKVNGLTINSPAEALQAFQQLQNESTVRLELLRRNRSTTLTYEMQ